MRQPGDQVANWSPAFIEKLLDYYLTFPYLGQETVIESKHASKSNEYRSIDDIIPE